MKNHKGFTLIELLVAVTIFTFLGGVLYTTFSHGLNLWKRASQEDRKMETLVFFEKLTGDVRNAVIYKDELFDGEKQELGFHAVAVADPLGRDNPKDVNRQVIRVRYYFNDKESEIVRESHNYVTVLYPKKEGKKQKPVLSHVKKLDLSYYELNTEIKDFFWKPSWKKSCLPGAIKVTLHLTDEVENKITRIIPLSGAEVCESVS